MNALLKEIRSKREVKINPVLQQKYNYCGFDIVLQTDPDGGVAGVVWFAYPRVLHWIEENYKNNPNIFKDKSVIELGAGTGLAGIVMAKCDANTELTDREETLPLLNINIELNNIKHNTKAKELNWGEETDNFKSSYDYIIVCDCIYNLSFGPQLLETMKSLSGTNSKIIFAFSTRNKEGERKYFETIEQYFNIERIEGGDIEDKDPNVFILTKK